MIDVFFYEVFEEEEKMLKTLLPEGKIFEFTPKTIQEEGHVEPPAPVICVRTQSKIPNQWAPRLEGILSRSQGYDHLQAYLKETGERIPCGYLKSYCSRAVAEHSILVMLALLRKLKKQLRHFETFDRDGLTGEECLNKKVLVVGVGKIGSHIVQIAKALGLAVKGVDVAPKNKEVTYVPLEEGVRWADVIFSAVPLTAKTAGLFNYSLLSQAKRGTFFINISRGETSSLEDLYKLLVEQHFAGVSLDVFENENQLARSLREKTLPKPKGTDFLERLRSRDDVLFTPHNAFNSSQAVYEKSRQTMEALTMFFETKKFSNPVPSS